MMTISGMSLHGLRMARRRRQHSFLLCPTSHVDYQYAAVTAAKRKAGLEGSPSEFNDHLRKRYRLEYSTADTLVVPSEMVKSTLVSHGIDSRRVRVIYHGVDLDRFAFNALPTRDRLSILFVGQIGVRKGIDVLLDACSRLDPASYELILVGDREPEAARILARHPEVQLLSEGYRQSVESYLSRADVLVLPSVEDGFGLVALEAMAAGRGVVVSDACGVSEIIASEGGGLVLPAGDAESLAAALRLLAFDREEVVRLGAKGREVAEKHPWDRWQDELAQVVAGSLGTPMHSVHRS